MTRTPQKDTSTYRFVGSHVDDLADGRILEPGGFYDLATDEVDDPHNKSRIDDGLLIAVPAAKEEN